MAHSNTAGAIARITREIASVQKGGDLSISVACRDSDVRTLRAMIIGPPSSPYEFGFFEFVAKFPKDYPITSPKVTCISTNSGRTRFNPNIYADGKVCLSILGTWRGQPGEEWSSAQGLESVLLSIQSLMSCNPYENEPGYETAKKEEPRPKAYIAKIRHETLRIAVIQRMEGLLRIRPERSEPAAKRFKANDARDSPASSKSSSSTDSSNGYESDHQPHVYDAEAAYNELDSKRWDPFADLMKRRFLWYYDSYIHTVDTHSDEQEDGTTFESMEFECRSNGMQGKFDYAGLRARLETIRRSLDEETHSWKQKGASQVAAGTQLAHQLAFQFKQLAYRWNESQYTGPRMEVSLPDPSNPFIWKLTIFGEPMTNLDGGIFNMVLHIPPKFPDMQPRLMIETPMHHHRVNSTGTLCYLPSKDDEIASHLEAIVATISDNDPKYDPRTMVNPEIFELYWGGEKKRKEYNRKLRRSAQDSTEFP